MIQPKAGTVTLIPIASLKADPNQPRKTFDPDSLKTLAESLKVRVEIPLIVRKVGKDFMIVDGERRLRAAKLAKLKTLPCVTYEMPEGPGPSGNLTIATSQLTTGVHREEYGALDIGEFLVDLQKREKSSMTQLIEALAKRGLVEIGRAKIDRYMSLVNLPEWAKDLVRDSKMSAAHAEYVLQTVKFPSWEKELKTRVNRDLQWRGSLTTKDMKEDVDQALRTAGIDLNNKYGNPSDVRAFNISVCQSCEFHVKQGKDEYCFNEKLFRAKQKEALEIKAARAAKKTAAVSDASRPQVVDDPLDVTPRKLKESKSGVVALKNLKYGSYQPLSEASFDPQMTCVNCPHNHLASRDGGDELASAHCFLPEHFAQLERDASRQQSRNNHFRELLEKHLRPIVAKWAPNVLKSSQQIGLILWASTGAVEQYSPHWMGGRADRAASTMQKFLGRKKLTDLKSIMEYSAVELSAEDLRSLTELTVELLTREQLRYIAHLIDYGLDSSPQMGVYRIDEAYVRFKRKSELQDMMKIAYPKLDTVAGLGMTELRAQMVDPLAIDAIGVPADMERLYHEPFEKPRDIEDDIGDAIDGDPITDEEEDGLNDALGEGDDE
jgi:ParB/RepB/Spo0J family partition protein